MTHKTIQRNQHPGNLPSLLGSSFPPCDLLGSSSGQNGDGCHFQIFRLKSEFTDIKERNNTQHGFPSVLSWVQMKKVLWILQAFRYVRHSHGGIHGILYYFHFILCIPAWPRLQKTYPYQNLWSVWWFAEWSTKEQIWVGWGNTAYPSCRNRPTWLREQNA